MRQLLAITVLAALALVPLPVTANEAEPDAGRMMLVLDASGSMAEPTGDGRTRIEAARASLNAVVDALADDQPVGMRVFGATDVEQTAPGACTDSQRVVDIDTGNADQLRDAIAAYQPVGWTPTSHALRAAAEDLGEDGRRTIVLVSDGEATCDPDPCEVAAELVADGLDVVIDVVGLDVDGTARESLQCIANQGNGTYYDANSTDTLTDALVKSSERAGRPYEAIGRPVTGGASPEDAPVITAGQWQDRLGTTDPEAEPQDYVAYYTVERTIPGSTLYVSASVKRPAHETASEQLAAETRADGRSCGSASLAAGTQYNTRLSTVAIVVGDLTRTGTACADAEEVTLEVRRGFGSSSQDEHAQIEAPLELTIIEDPPPADPEPLPESLPEPTDDELPLADTMTPVVGGTSFTNGPVLSDGSYTGTLVPGESQVFLVDVDWGQNLRTRIDVPGLTDAQSEAFRPAYSSAWVNVSLRSPARGTVSTSDRTSVQVTGRDSSATITSHPVVYRHRELPRGRTRNASLAGRHAVVVSLIDHPFERSVEVPFTLTTAVEGEVQGVPDYPEPVEVEQPGSTDDGTADDGSGPPWLPIGLGAAGVLLILAAVVVWASRRSRTTSHPAAGPHPEEHP